MRTDLVAGASPVTGLSSGGLAGSSALSLTQQVLSDLGWKDLRPAMLAAEQVDHDMAIELQLAQTAYAEEPQERQRVHLLTMIDKAIEKLQADYQRANLLKEKAQQQHASASKTVSSSYLSRLSDWMVGGLQSFFGSDDTDLVERYTEIANNRTQAMVVLMRYRKSIAAATELTEEEVDLGMMDKIEEEQVLDKESLLTAVITMREAADEAEIIEFNTEEGEKLPTVYARLLQGEEAQSEVVTSIRKFPAALTLTQLNGRNGFVINGATDGDFIGLSIAGLGDINEDGIDDIGIGGEGGNTYIIFGSSQLGKTGNMSVSSLNGTQGFVIPATGTNIDSGDVNGDGILDILLCTPQGAKIIFGSPTLGATGQFDLMSLNGSAGFQISMGHACSVEMSGDINGNGIDDLVVGDGYENPLGRTHAGSSYVIYGHEHIGASGLIDLSTLNGTNGFKIIGERSSTFTGGSDTSWQGILDINSDGYHEVVISAPGTGVYILYGNNSIATPVIDLSLLNARQGFKIREGVTVSMGATDLNQDGHDDLMMAATSYSSVKNNAGRVYVLFGKRDIGRSGIIDLTQATNGVDGFYIDGVEANDFLGYGLSLAGDVDKDGIQDMILGAMQVADNGGPTINKPGKAYVVFGKSTLGSNGFVDLTTLDGNNGFTLLGDEINQGCGRRVAAAGDINNDGVGDFLVACLWADPYGRNNAGRVYVVYGNAPPILSQAVWHINEGQVFALSPAVIQVTDENHFADEIVLRAESVRYGQFERRENPGINMTQFTQQEIDEDKIIFRPDGSRNAPSFQWVVTDGIAELTASALIDFNIFPVLIKNELSIRQGDSQIITIDDLSAEDPDHTGLLTFMVSNIQHGRFEFCDESGIAMMQFNQTAVETGRVCFVHDDSDTAPSYQVSVSDGELSSAPQESQITFDRRPVLINNAFSLKDGDTVVMTTAMLNASDDQASAGILQYSVSEIQNARFELSDRPGTAITQFTQAQLQAGQVRLVHAGNNQAPYFKVSVSDGALSSLAQSADVTFNFRPIINNNSLVIKQGETVLITPSLLSATDGGSLTDTLNFTVSAVQHGRFEWVSSPGVAITQFTQAQLQAGQVRFAQDGTAVAPSYQVSVSDGVFNTTPVSGSVTFNQAPVLVNNTLALKDGDTVLLTTEMLGATDDQTEAGDLIFSVSTVQRGQFAFVSDPGIPITQFTQQQVQSGQVCFVHDGSNVAPSYRVSVSDGPLSSAATTATVTFNRRPVITVNQMVINEGETVFLNSTMLAVNDDQNSSALVFTVLSLQGGYFALASAPTVPVTQFTFTQIQWSQIVFVQTGAGVMPGYSLTVTDGTSTSLLSSAVVAFNPKPVLLYNSLNLRGQGLTLVMTATELRASDNHPDAQLVFTASAVRNGHFELTTRPGSAVEAFTQAEITAGRVQFIRNNLIDLPSYAISVSDGILSTSPSAAIVSFNARPVIDANVLSLRDSESLLITTAMLHATDDDSDSELTFTIDHLQGGRFELITATGVNITQWTQQQIATGQVRFVHDGGNQAPSYTVSASDGELSTVQTPATITFHPRPVINTHTLTLNDGESVILTSATLNVTADQSSSGLTYTVSDIEQGRFELVTNAGVGITQFMQQQVSDGQVRFVHAGGNIAPSYQISVSDGVLSSTPLSATVVFNQRPLLVRNNLTLKDGETVVITSAMVNASDDEAIGSGLSFTVSAVQNGHFEWDGSPGTAVTQFTQAQIQAGQVHFVHVGNNQAPSYALSASDGSLATPAEPATITFKRRPTFTHHHLVMTEGRAAVITPSMLSAQSDASEAWIVFTVNNIQHGRFTRVSTPDIAITQFTQQEINVGQIQFVPDSSGLKPDYVITLSDPFFTLPPAAANVTFSPPIVSPQKSTDWPLIGGSVGAGAGVVILALLCVLYRRRHKPFLQVRNYIDSEIELDDEKVPATISYDELKLQEARSGSGSYGIVYKGMYNGKEVAIKKLNTERLSEEAFSEFKKESDIVASMHSKRLTQLYAVCLAAPNYCLVMEWMPGGSLHNLLKTTPSLPWSNICQIALDVATGLLELHEKNIVHRDLKSSNVLLDNGGVRAKISDFGLVKVKSELEDEKVLGTLPWAAPELFTEEKSQRVATDKTDVYSLGMVLWELVATPYRTPFEKVSLLELAAKKVSRGLDQEEIPKHCPKEFARLIRRCWQQDPDRRPSARELANSLQILFEKSNQEAKQAPPPRPQACAAL